MSEDSEQTDQERLQEFKKITRGPFGKGRSHLLYDLDLPALRVAGSHKRMMGFWVLTWISLVKDGLHQFFNNGGKMRLIIGIPFSKDSYDALIASAATANSTLKRKLRTEFFELLDDYRHWLNSDASELFLHMVASDQFEIRLLPDRGIDEGNAAEHSKLRIFRCENEIYAYSGSANDTYAALMGRKELGLAANVTWSPDPWVSASAREGETVFDEEWHNPHALELDSSAIPILEELRQRHQFNEEYGESSEVPKHLKEIENHVRKLQVKGKSAILYLQSEADLIDAMISSRPMEFNPDLLDFIPVRDDEESDELFLYSLYCGQYNVQTSTFADSALSRNIALSQLKSFVATNNLYSQCDFEELGRKHHTGNTISSPYAIWSGIYHSLGIDIPDHAPISEETTGQKSPLTPPSNSFWFWDDEIFHYPWLKERGDLEPCQHQIDALIKWQENGYRGIFQHATGTYKTATGVCAAAHLLSKETCHVVLISSPYRQVSRQWFDLAEKCFSNVMIVPCWGDFPDWKKRFRAASEQSRLHGKKLLAIFVENSLFGDDTHSKFAVGQLALLEKGTHEWGIIADEMHNWIRKSSNSASQRFIDTFENGCTYRLGLSAKVDKHGEGNLPQNVMMKDWFSKDRGATTYLVDDFPLDRAIREGFLRSYWYECVPIPVNVSDDYVAKHGVHKAIERAKSLFSSQIREYAAKNSFSQLSRANRLLIYTGPEVKDASRLVQAIEENRGMLDSAEINKFTSREGSKEREQILRDFKSSKTKLLVAIKCLDEGVNLPIADAAMMVLSSEDDDRQWIQRRGRILRRIGTEDTQATIIDFYPKFSVNNPGVLMELEKLQTECLRRVEEFATTAVPAARRKLIKDLQGQ